MEKTKVELFLAINGKKFEPTAIPAIREALEKMTDEQFSIIQATEFEYRDPSIILIVAILLGWDRFFLDDIAMGVLKVLTCQGLGIWWIVDIFTAVERTKKYNYSVFMKTAAYIR